MATEAFTVRTEPDIIHQLDSIAGILDRSRNYLVNQAIKEYLVANTRVIDKAKQSIVAEERDELVSHNDPLK